MPHTLAKPPQLPRPESPRAARSGPFFDYVNEAGRQYASRQRAERARLARRDRLAEDRQTSPEERWEAEGGNTGSPAA
jgi:hypothetical protein